MTNITASFGGTGGSGNTVDALFTTAAKGTHVEAADQIVVGEARVMLDGLLEFLTGGRVGTPLLKVVAERGSYDEIVIDLPLASLTLAAGAGHKTSPHETSLRLDREPPPTSCCKMRSRYRCSTR